MPSAVQDPLTVPRGLLTHCVSGASLAQKPRGRFTPPSRYIYLVVLLPSRCMATFLDSIVTHKTVYNTTVPDAVLQDAAGPGEVSITLACVTLCASEAPAHCKLLLLLLLPLLPSLLLARCSSSDR